MEKRPFLVTGAGRSGTLFLAKTLDRSKAWNVSHEHPNDHRYLESPTDLNADKLITRFGSEVQGEVNSQLRRIAPALSDRGLRVYFVVRHPIDIIKSVHAARGRSRDQFVDTIKQVLPTFTDIFLLNLFGFKCFKFEKFTTDKAYFLGMINELGVHDIDASAIDLSNKVNSNGPGTMEDWDLNNDERYGFLDKCGWFMREFGYR